MIVPNPTPCAAPILVIDDDEDILRMTSFVLNQLGYRVVVAADAQTGISELRDRGTRPCLILLDLMMPVMDGTAFRNEVRAIPDAAEIPIVILSGDDELATKAANLQVAGFERKPISVARLSALAEKYCQPESA